MILESIVTTVDCDGVVNVAPMGPIVPEDTLRWRSFELRPFKTSRTYANLRVTNVGVLHVTDDVYLLAQGVLGQVEASLVPACNIRGHRLEDCCRFFEFEIERWDESSERTRAWARVLHTEEVRPFFGLCRAKFAVVELAILTSRLGILPYEEITHEMERLRPLVEKTGSAREADAFRLLAEHIAANGRGAK